MTTRTALATCCLCEALCGVKITIEDEQVIRIAGDPDDPHSKGHICPKATALGDLHHDPDRLRQPMRREGETWSPIGWGEAIEWAGRRLGSLQRAHGRDAVGMYFGNPTGHSYQAMLGVGAMRGPLGTANLYSSASVDALPRQVVSFLMYGNQARIPVPDVDRTDFFLILGANPVVSQGSVMTAPGMKGRLKALRARGGRLVVVDPRRTETAALADTHLFIRPGADALFVAALLHVVLADDASADLAPLANALAPFEPEAVAPATGIDASTIRQLARDFASAERAVAYGRMGVSVSRFGATATWLIEVLNSATGNLDAVGGAMFSRPAVDLATLAERLGQRGGFGPTTSDGLPTFNHERPVAGLASTIERGELRGFITHAGNPVLSLPGGRRLDRAMATLDVYVAIDPYLNETTRHADLILPPPSALERDWFGLLFNGLAVREIARYNPPVFDRADGQPTDWWILTRLTAAIMRHRGPMGWLGGSAMSAATTALSAPRLLDLMLRTGHYRLSRRRLAEHPHGLDLGARQPGRLKEPPKLCPPRFLDDLSRLAATMDTPRPELVVIGRRTLRSMNSWLHNSRRMVKGRPRCTARMHPDDAHARGLSEGQRVAIVGGGGRIELPLELTDELMVGVVSVPHGWGHHRKGTRQSVATEHAGASLNDALDTSVWDAVSGVSELNGASIEVIGLA